MESKGSISKLGFLLRGEVFPWLIFILITAGATSLVPRIASVDFTTDFLANFSALAIVTIAEVIVLISGNMDLSVASTVALSGILIGWLSNAEPGASGLVLHPLLAAAIVIALTTGIGAFNGFIVGRVGINSFLHTFVMMIVLRGLCLAITMGHSLYQFNHRVFWLIGSERLFNITHVCTLVMIAAFIIFYLILERSKFGWHLYATGGNKAAARQMGVDVVKTTILAFTLNGFLCGLAGLLYVSRLRTAGATMAADYLFLVFIAAVIGGVSLFGGVGSIIGVVPGVLTVGMIQVILNVIQVSPFLIEGIRGAILIVAIIVDAIKSKSWTKVIYS